MYPATYHQHQALLNGEDVATGDGSCHMVLSEHRLPQLQRFMVFPTQIVILGNHLFINKPKYHIVHQIYTINIH